MANPCILWSGNPRMWRRRPDVFRRRLIGILIAMLIVGGFPVAGVGRQVTASRSTFCSAPSLAKRSDRSALKLKLTDRSIIVGGNLYSRIENRTPEDVLYGAGQTIQRWKAGHWVSLPSGPALKWLRVIPPESAAHCQRVRVPTTALPGRYRVWKTVSRRSDIKSQIRLTAYFQIHPKDAE